MATDEPDNVTDQRIVAIAFMQMLRPSQKADPQVCSIIVFGFFIGRRQLFQTYTYVSSLFVQFEIAYCTSVIGGPLHLMTIRNQSTSCQKNVRIIVNIQVTLHCTRAESRRPSSFISLSRQALQAVLCWHHLRWCVFGAAGCQPTSEPFAASL